MKKNFQSYLLAFTLTFFLSTQAYAFEAFFQLKNDSTHCGSEYELNLYEGIIAALSTNDDSASELKFRPESDEFKLELMIHYNENETEVPENCQHRLLELSQRAKEKKIGDLLIRSSTGKKGSTELDLAIASKRLEFIKRFFRTDRLARRAFILELHPLPSSLVLENSIKKPQIVEIYSSPLN